MPFLCRVTSTLGCIGPYCCTCMHQINCASYLSDCPWCQMPPPAPMSPSHNGKMMTGEGRSSRPTITILLPQICQCRTIGRHCSCLFGLISYVNYVSHLMEAFGLRGQLRTLPSDKTSHAQSRTRLVVTSVNLIPPRQRIRTEEHSKHNVPDHRVRRGIFRFCDDHHSRWDIRCILKSLTGRAFKNSLRADETPGEGIRTLHPALPTRFVTPPGFQLTRMHHDLDYSLLPKGNHISQAMNRYLSH